VVDFSQASTQLGQMSCGGLFPGINPARSNELWWQSSEEEGKRRGKRWEMGMVK